MILKTRLKDNTKEDDTQDKTRRQDCKMTLKTRRKKDDTEDKTKEDGTEDKLEDRTVR